MPALESELTNFLCSVSSLREAVHHKSDGSLWASFFLQLLKMLPLGARDAHGCLVYLGDRVVVSFVFSPSLW